MIIITEKAREKMINILTEEDASILRFGLKGGGCSGFQYFFTIEESKEADDSEYVLDDKCILVVDSASIMYLDAAEIDYKKDLMGESFIFSNPGQKTTCGCGSSVGF